MRLKIKIKYSTIVASTPLPDAYIVDNVEDEPLVRITVS
jgi:hypothetical protein